MLNDLREKRVRELVEGCAERWPRQSRELGYAMGRLTAYWMNATPAEREQEVGELIAFVSDWIDELDAPEPREPSQAARP